MIEVLKQFEEFENDYVNIWEELGVKEDDSYDVIKDKLKVYYKNHDMKDPIKRFTWKLCRDPYYYVLYKDVKKVSILYNSGFFLDRYMEESSLDIDMLTTPVGKLRRCLENMKDTEGKLVVLLCTGAFSPVHKGHLMMMEKAKRILEENGYKVIGGYLSPSHDEYVSQKYNGKAKMNIEKRVHLLEKAVSDYDWLHIDIWEGYYREYAINFTEVMWRLEKYLNVHLEKYLKGNKVEIAYVYGSDNLEFSNVFKHRGIGVCVSRGNYDNEKWKELREYLKGSNVYFVEVSDKNISSSDVRNGKIEYLLPSVREEYEKWNKIIGIYEIRNDFNLSIKNMINDIEMEKENEIRLIKLISEFIDDGLEVEILNVNEQIEKFNKEMGNENIISLDIYVKGMNNVGVSRVFDCSDGQIKSLYLSNRLGTDELEKQLKRVKKGSYWLVDDDKASGYTVNKIISMLDKDVEIKGFIGLNDLVRTKKEKSYDIVDMRDFILGSCHGGLVVELPNGKLSRVIYALPYVSVKSRATIRLGKEREFSLRVWEWNRDFYKGKNKRLKDLDVNIKNWIEYVGFTGDDLVEDFINYHINYLKRYVM